MRTPGTSLAVARSHMGEPAGPRASQIASAVNHRSLPEFVAGESAPGFRATPHPSGGARSTGGPRSHTPRKQTLVSCHWPVAGSAPGNRLVHGITGTDQGSVDRLFSPAVTVISNFSAPERRLEEASYSTDVRIEGELAGRGVLGQQKRLLQKVRIDAQLAKGFPTGGCGFNGQAARLNPAQAPEGQHTMG